jgi:hypothetical protein
MPKRRRTTGHDDEAEADKADETVLKRPRRRYARGFRAAAWVASSAAALHADLARRGKPMRIVTVEDRDGGELEHVGVQRAAVGAYARRHGYVHDWRSEWGDGLTWEGEELPVYWKKLQYVERVLATCEATVEYVVWLDSDAVVMRGDELLEALVVRQPHGHVWMGLEGPLLHEDNSLCAGVMLFRNSAEARGLLRAAIGRYVGDARCRDAATGRPTLRGPWAGYCYEQGVLNELLLTDDAYRPLLAELTVQEVYNGERAEVDSLILHLYGEKRRGLATTRRRLAAFRLALARATDVATNVGTV